MHSNSTVVPPSAKGQDFRLFASLSITDEHDHPLEITPSEPSTQPSDHPYDSSPLTFKPCIGPLRVPLSFGTLEGHGICSPPRMDGWETQLVIDPQDMGSVSSQNAVLLAGIDNYKACKSLSPSRLPNPST